MSICLRAGAIARAAGSVAAREVGGESIIGGGEMKSYRTFSSDLMLREHHLETHWRGQLLKFDYKTLRAKLNLKPTRDQVWDAGYERRGKVAFGEEDEECTPLFVIRTQDTIDIEWDDGTTSKLTLS